VPAEAGAAAGITTTLQADGAAVRRTNSSRYPDQDERVEGGDLPVADWQALTERLLATGYSRCQQFGGVRTCLDVGGVSIRIHTRDGGAFAASDSCWGRHPFDGDPDHPGFAGAVANVRETSSNVRWELPRMEPGPR